MSNGCCGWAVEVMAFCTSVIIYLCKYPFARVARYAHELEEWIIGTLFIGSMYIM